MRRKDWPPLVRYSALLLFSGSAACLLFGQAVKAAPASLETGEQIYKTGCVACHGADGKGTAKTIRGFKAPDTFPDFTRCDQTTAEPDTTWKAIITHGGPNRGFSPIMPSFSEALSPEQIDKVIGYLRGFCRNSHWPRGELNLPRAIVTEKAYPEDEVVLSTAVNAEGAPGVESHIIHEQRFGVKNQIEVDVPVNFADQDHTWYGGIGDTTLGVKRTFFSSLRTGSIFSLQGSVILPSGSRSRGLAAELQLLRPLPLSTNFFRPTPSSSFRPAPIFRGTRTSHRNHCSGIRQLAKASRGTTDSGVYGRPWWSF